MMTTYCKNKDILLLLLEHKADVNIKNAMGMSALMSSCIDIHNTACSHLLIAHGADLNLKDNNGRTALMTAIAHKNESLALKLIDCGADVSVRTDKGPSALNLASEYSEVSVVQQIISKKVSAEVLNHQDKNGNTSLMISSFYGHTKIAALLVDAGALIDITNSANNNTLYSPPQRVRINLVQEKCAGEINCHDTTGSFALILSSNKGNTGIVDLLLKRGATVNLQDSVGVTSLMNCCYHGHIETTRSILKYNADVNLQDKTGWSALMFAVAQKHESIVVLLARERALIDMQDVYGTSSLMLSCLFGCEGMVKILLRHDADVNHQNIEGITALMIASYIGNDKIVEILIVSGANLNMQSNTGLTALGIATDRGNTGVSQLLKKHGAKGKESFESGAVLSTQDPCSIQSTSTKHVSDDKKTPSLQDLKRLLTPIAYEWHNIGVLLNIAEGILKNIQQKNKDRPEDCLLDMIIIWIKQSPPPSWIKLKEVLECIKRKDIANQIALLHPSNPQLHPMEHDSLPGKPTLTDSFKLLCCIPHEYHKIGVQLGLQENELKSIEYDNPNRAIDCLREVLSMWINNHPSPQWDQLIKALRYTNNHKVAEMLLSLRIK